MTDKQKIHKSNFRKIAIITGVALIVFAIIVRIGFMVAAGDKSKPIQASASIIQVEGLNDDTITTTDVNYKLVYTVKKPAEATTTQTTKVFLNDNQRIVTTKDKNADLIHYSTGVLLLKNGENKIKIVVSENKPSEKSREVATKYMTIKLEASEKPTISITSAAEINAGWRIKNVKKDTYQLDVDTAPKDSKNSGATSFTINGKTIASDSGRGHFSYKLTGLKEGDNVFILTAKNNKGEASGKLVVKRVAAVEKENDSSDDSKWAFQNLIVEAQAACAQYAEITLSVKDINVSYDQSSIKKQNPDGTIFLKANIADSRGFLHSEQPLGIMECTTNSTGMTVLSFNAY